MKKLYVILLFICILMLSSCGAMDENGMMGDSVDGISFDRHDTYIINEIEYDVYLPRDVEEALYYRYKEGNITSNSSSWTVNFMYNAQYHVDNSKENQSTWDELYLKLIQKEQILEEKCGFDITFFEPNSEVELEYVLENKNQEEASYVIFYTYLPLRILNTETNVRSTIGIPVTVEVLKKVNQMVENPFNDEMMLWEDFLAIEKL